MEQWLRETSPVLLALLATLFTWGVTALGACLVVFTKTVSQKFLDAAMGMTAQEGSAVALPLRREGLSRKRALWYGQLSGIVEPIAGVIGAAAVLIVTPILPYALAFAAGAMIFVAAEELIPESQANDNVDTATTGVIVGFAIMMSLDVALG